LLKCKCKLQELNNKIFKIIIIIVYYTWLQHCMGTHILMGHIKITTLRTTYWDSQGYIKPHKEHTSHEVWVLTSEQLPKDGHIWLKNVAQINLNTL
jgi:hypothetical protein